MSVLERVRSRAAGLIAPRGDYTPGSGALPNVIIAGPPQGNAAADTATIQGAINAAALFPTGVVQLRGGVYNLSSSARSDTVSVGNGSASWTDASITAADLGKYVLARTGNTRVPQIITVNPGVGFTTDVTSAAVITSGTALIVQPGVVVPYGVRVQGIGRFSTSQFANPSSSIVVGTKLVDSGTGVTVMGVGSTTYGGDGISLAYMAIWGSNGGVVGSTFCGLYLGDNQWFAEIERVDLSWHGTAGLVLDANLNSLDSHNSSYQNNGTVGATTPTGGVLTCYFQSQTSACINFYNDFFFNNFGMGIGGGLFTSGIGKVASVINSQIANTFQTSFSPYSGYGLVLHSDIGGAQANVLNAWIGTNQIGDLWLNGGALEVINTTCTSAVNSPVETFGALSLRGCQLWSNNANACINNGQINWSACTLNGSATNLYSGGPTAAQCLGHGSSIAHNFGGTTGIGNGASGNLTALAKSTGTGPASDVVNAWIPVTINGTAGWVPFFV